MVDESPLQAEIYEIIEPFASTSVTKKISNIVGLMKISAHVDNLLPEMDRIHVANGTLMLDGSFSTSMDQIVRCRFPIRYNPDAGEPTKWLHFLNQLLYPEDIPTLQEYVGYCLIPSTAAQKMMASRRAMKIIVSQIGQMRTIFSIVLVSPKMVTVCLTLKMPKLGASCHELVTKRLVSGRA